MQPLRHTMTELLPVLFAGFSISFLGQLPLGNLNVLATQMAVQESYKNAWLFSIAGALVEVTYLRIALSSSAWILNNKEIFTYVTWFTVVLFYVLGFVSIRRAIKNKEQQKKGVLIDNKINRFLLGLMLSAINPMQIPFWFLWGTFFINNGTIKPFPSYFTAFTIGAGLGTLSGQAIYIHGGTWLIKKLKSGYKVLNILMGVVFIISASVQLYKLLFGAWAKK